MSTSTEICLADVQRAGNRIRLAQQVTPDSPTGRRLSFIAGKINELEHELTGRLIEERRPGWPQQ